MGRSTKTALIVDDDEFFRMALRTIITNTLEFSRMALRTILTNTLEFSEVLEAETFDQATVLLSNPSYSLRMQVLSPIDAAADLL